jgi:hypothetical protein
MIDLSLLKLGESALSHLMLILDRDVQRCELPQLLIRVAEDGAKCRICC